MFLLQANIAKQFYFNNLVTSSHSYREILTTKNNPQFEAQCVKVISLFLKGCLSDRLKMHTHSGLVQNILKSNEIY